MYIFALGRVLMGSYITALPVKGWARCEWLFNEPCTIILITNQHPKHVPVLFICVALPFFTLFEREDNGLGVMYYSFI